MLYTYCTFRVSCFQVFCSIVEVVIKDFGNVFLWYLFIMLIHSDR
jgi:hypothetical protein